MRVREGVLALLLALATALIVFSVAANQQQQHAAQMSRQLLQQVYVRALREYYQWLNDLRLHGPQSLQVQSSGLLAPYTDQTEPETGDWQLQFSLHDLQPRLQLPVAAAGQAELFMHISSPDWPDPVSVRLDLFGWLEQLTVDLGYGVLPLQVLYQQQPLRPGERLLQRPQVFHDFLFPEFSLVLDADPLQQRFLYHRAPLLSAGLAALLVLVAVLLLLQQWYQRQRLSLALAETEANLLEQMRHNAHQERLLRDHSQTVVGLNEHLNNARQQLELSERLAGLGELSAGIAHEINNPVAYVRSNLQALQQDFTALSEFITTLDKASDELDLHSPVFQRLLKAYQALHIADVLKQVPDRMHDCQQGIERAARIVSDMRKLSRSGHDKHWCQVNDDILSVINIARARLPTGVSLEYELIELPDIYCNPSQIGQVVSNMLVNAMQALEAGGGAIYLHQQLQNNELRITIRDNGPGMDEQTAARVFEPFFTTKLDGEGTGLGLALCYKLMQAHAGRIELQTSPGQGACFSLVLPLDGGADHAQ